MSFLVSPGVEVNEIDLTNIIPAVSTSIGGYAGYFRWGPIGNPVTVSSEKELASIFGAPTEKGDTETSFFTASSFLKYGNSLKVSRAKPDNGGTAYSNAIGSIVGLTATTPTLTNYYGIPGKWSATDSAVISNSVTSDEGTYWNEDIRVKVKVRAGGGLVTNLSTVGLANIHGQNFVTGDRIILKVNAGDNARSSATTNPVLNVSATDGDIVGLSLDTTHTSLIDPANISEAWAAAANYDRTNINTYPTLFDGIDFAGDADLYEIVTKEEWEGGDARTPTPILNDLDPEDAIVVSFRCRLYTGADAIIEGGSGIRETPGTYLPKINFTSTGVGANALTLTPTIGTVTDSYFINSLEEVNLNRDALIENDIRVVARYSGALGNGLRVYFITKNTVSSAAGNPYNIGLQYQPGTTDFTEALTGKTDIDDEVAVLVVDQLGNFTGKIGTIVESFEGLSFAKNAKNQYGQSIYWPRYLNQYSSYVWGVEYDDDPTITANTVDPISTPTWLTSSLYLELNGGQDGSSTSASPVVNALDLFADTELIDVNFIFAQAFDEDAYQTGQATYAIDQKIITIVNSRKDCLGFISAPLNVHRQTSDDARKDKVLAKFEQILSSSYLVFDSSPVYVYNSYRDDYVWIPACGHMAGLCANTDEVADPWFSPAGLNRGNLIGVTRLAYNPKQADRDELYVARVNPIVSFPGQGILLYGDKTALSKPSAFDRINVRRLFLVLEKAIATAAKFQLFELNDEFTRTTFRNAVVPYLRDIQGRRGITDFRVICDESNNTGEVIDSNRFTADIFIKPARSINFITLNFIATRTGVAFEEVIGL